MAAFVRLFPQLHKNAAGIPVTEFEWEVWKKTGKRTKRKIIRPAFFDMSHPTRERETSCDPGSFETVISEALASASLQAGRVFSADVRINPAEKRKSQYRPKHEPRQRN